MVFISWCVPVCGKDLYSCKMLKDVLLLLYCYAQEGYLQKKNSPNARKYGWGKVDIL